MHRETKEMLTGSIAIVLFGAARQLVPATASAFSEVEQQVLVFLAAYLILDIGAGNHRAASGYTIGAQRYRSARRLCRARAFAD